MKIFGKKTNPVNVLIIGIAGAVIVGFLVMSSGCSSWGGNAHPEHDSSTVPACQYLIPISYSREDTDETITQIITYNLVYEELCLEDTP